MISFVLLTAFLAATPYPPELANQLDEAWDLLQRGVHNKNTDQGSKAVAARSLLAHNSKAEEWAESALSHPQPEMRIPAANTLGKLVSLEALRAARSNKKWQARVALSQVEHIRVNQRLQSNNYCQGQAVPQSKSKQFGLLGNR